MSDVLDKYFRAKKWEIVDVLTIPSRKGMYYEYDDLIISNQALEFLRKSLPSSSQGLYKHQKEAIRRFIAGKNICLSTGTASGKSLVFYVSAIEQLVRYPDSKVIAIYPLRALGQEQQERWEKALYNAGVDAKVGRIDGQIPIHSRTQILENSRVLIVTPDIIHAWLMYNLNDRVVINFLSKLSLVVVDEVHNYAGVFGSNAAYLFRRMRHIMSLLNCFPQYIAASATIRSPEIHLNNLLGLDFDVIGLDWDTSPREKLTIKLVIPPKEKDLLTGLSQFLEFVVKHTGHKFITFVDSRKQAEYIASISSRFQVGEEVSLDYDHLQKLKILPYRAGYEENDRKVIQQRLRRGKLRGVISTSALELGIDIPFLTLGILVGVPHSATSFYQRIGRIGRRSEGEIIVINTGDMYSENIFRNPRQLLDMPLSEGALYLENPRIQYIHAMCLARQGGEHDQACSYAFNGEEMKDFQSPVDWPNGFLDLCKFERTGMIPPEFQAMKAQAGDDPNHTYPLRDVDVQFQVEYRRGPERRFLGSLSYNQLMREAYPGAVYYYTAKPYRVYRVRVHSRLVEVRPEKRYTTKPRMLPTLVFPNLRAENVYRGKKYGDLIVLETDLQIREAIIGFKERRGPTELVVDYPLAPSLGLYFEQSRFTRNYFTTGVIIAHPIFNSAKVKVDVIANLLFESFLMIIPFERRDLHFASDKFRVGNCEINKGDRFACIYDQTYGSLRLSGRLLENQVLDLVLKKAIELAEHSCLDVDTIGALRQLMLSLFERPMNVCQRLSEEMTVDNYDTTHFVKVILPGTKGMDVRKDNEEFWVEGVFYSPVIQGLAYRGKYLYEKNNEFDDTVVIIPIDSLVEIPGESKLGLYDVKTGEIKEL